MLLLIFSLINGIEGHRDEKTKSLYSSLLPNVKPITPPVKRRGFF